MKYIIPKGTEVRLYRKRLFDPIRMLCERTLYYSDEELDSPSQWSRDVLPFCMPENDRGYNFLVVNKIDVETSTDGISKTKAKPE
jgi:hypothetical protein